MNGGEAIVMLTLFTGGFATIFGIYYLRTRQNLAMIDKGMNPKKAAEQPAPAPYKNLKWALLLIGAGLGLFLAFLLDRHILPPEYHYGENGARWRDDDNNAAIYFALIAIGGGVGLFGSYLMEKKWLDTYKKQERGE